MSIQMDWQKKAEEARKKVEEAKKRTEALRLAREERTGKPVGTTAHARPQSALTMGAATVKRDRPPPAPIPPRTTAPSGASEYNRKDFGKY